MKLLFSWYSPTHGDGEYIGSKDPKFEGANYILQNAIEAEKANFDSILIPTGPTCTDSFITATHIASLTKKIKPLIAVRPGFIAPSVAAKMVATLDIISNGRVSLNIVTGGSPIELAMDGDFVEHDKRYERTDEFIEVMKRVWLDDSFSFEGNYFHTENTKIPVKPIQNPYPKLYLGGSSESALKVAVKHIDTYLMWGEPVEKIKEQITKIKLQSNQSLRFGMRINLIVADTETEAWEKAEEMLANVSKHNNDYLNKYLANSDSTALQRIQSLRGKVFDDPCYWTGMVPYRSGNSTALVGSSEQIIDSLKKYMEAGITEFIFSSYPHLETVSYIGDKIIPALKYQNA